MQAMLRDLRKGRKRGRKIANDRTWENPGVAPPHDPWPRPGSQCGSNLATAWIHLGLASDLSPSADHAAARTSKSHVAARIGMTGIARCSAAARSIYSRATERLQRKPHASHCAMNIESASPPTPVECAATRCANACAPRLELVTKEQNWRITLNVGGECIPRSVRCSLSALNLG